MLQYNLLEKAAPINDGVSWKLEDNSLELGNAILGTLTQAPSEEEDFTDSDRTDEESEEEPLSPSPDIIGVPVDDDKEKMDIREGEESYSALVEESLS